MSISNTRIQGLVSIISDTHTLFLHSENLPGVCTAQQSRIDSHSAAHGTIPILLNEPPNGSPFIKSKPRPRSWIPASSWGAKTTNDHSASSSQPKNAAKHSQERPPRAGQLDPVETKSQTTTYRNVQSIPHTPFPASISAAKIYSSFC